MARSFGSDSHAGGGHIERRQHDLSRPQTAVKWATTALPAVEVVPARGFLLSGREGSLMGPSGGVVAGRTEDW